MPTVPKIMELGSVEQCFLSILGGNWVTVGYRFPPGPSLEVHFGRRYSDRFQLEARVEAEVGWGRRAREAQGKGG